MIAYEERLEIARRSLQGKNCISTALFLAGYLDEDVHVEPEDFDKNFEDRLIRLKKPEPKSLARVCHFDSGLTLHMGIVTNIEPLKVTHRRETNGKLFEGDNLNNFINIGLHFPLDYGFYILG